MKIKAFTIIELVVVMILTAIIATIAYLAIQNTQQSYSLFENNTDEALKISRFRTLLQKDFETSQYATFENNQLILTTEKGIIRYTFQESNINRTIKNVSDNFEINSNNFITSFQKEPTNNGYIDFFQFNIQLFERERTLSFIKKYSSVNLKIIEEQSKVNSDRE